MPSVSGGPRRGRSRLLIAASVLAHAGIWRDAQTVRHRFEFNYHLRAHQTQSHEGSLKEEHYFLQVQPDKGVKLDQMRHRQGIE